MYPSPEVLLQQINDRDTEICVLLQRTRLLNSVIKSPMVDDRHGFASQNEMGSFDALKERLAVVCGCQEKVRYNRQ